MKNELCELNIFSMYNTKNVCMYKTSSKSYEAFTIFTFFQAAYEIPIGDFVRSTTEKCGSDTSSIIIDSIIDHRGTQGKLKEAISEDIRSISPTDRACSAVLSTSMANIENAVNSNEILRNPS